MKTEKYYFYEKNESNNNFVVYEVNSFNGNVDKADRKARTIAIKRNKKLAGGYFVETCKPYDFKTNYKIIKVKDNTKIDPYNAKDLFIIDLIEKESNMEYVLI
jgi:hypothetical protein